MNYLYDKNTDYQALIDQAIGQGNYYMAAIYEQQRNAKIAGEGMQGVSQTSNYAKYLPVSSGNSGSATGMQTTVQPSSYTNPYIQKLNEAMNKVTGKYSYNPDTDPIAAAYKKSYLREADRAMQDTLGEYSTMTGGIPSAQAVAAASQSADNYKAQLALKLAELGQQAYDRDLSKVNMLMSAAQDADNRYYTAISSAMSRWAQLGAADEQVASVLGVPVGAMTGDAQYQQWQKALGEREYALSLLASGVMPTSAQLGAAGISPEQAQQLLATPSYSGGSGSGSGSSSKSGGKLVSKSDREKLAPNYKAGGEEAIAADLAYYKNAGYDTEELLEWLNEWYGNASEKSTDEVTYGPGMSESSFAQFMRVLTANAAARSGEDTQSYIETMISQYAEEMSEEQWRYVQQWLDRQGG